MASIPDVKAVAYDVCGVVRMADAGFRAKVGTPPLSPPPYAYLLLLVHSCCKK